jgi:phthalate 4,5-cis-dihydrodiol dehydrogenase
MALNLPDCQRMIEAAKAASVQLMVGHSHSLDAPYLQARKMIDSGAYGRVRMITALNFTDFLYRPRRPEELDTTRGGGVVFSQAAHQVDIVRLLGGGRVRTLRCATGAWDKARPTEGAYSAFLTFEDGAFASMTYSGYAHFDTDAFTGWIGELGQSRDPLGYGEARAKLRQVGSPEAEAALKNARNYGVAAIGTVAPTAHNHFGLIIVSCEQADLRPTPHGVEVYGDDAVTFHAIPPPDIPRTEVIDEFLAAIRDGRRLIHSGEWGLATMEVCLAMLGSAKSGREVSMKHQEGLLS